MRELWKSAVCWEEEGYRFHVPRPPSRPCSLRKGGLRPEVCCSC